MMYNVGVLKTDYLIVLTMRTAIVHMMKMLVSFVELDSVRHTLTEQGLSNYLML